MNPSRHIELDVDIGADAKDWSAIEAAEKLKPVETELRRIEETIQEVVNEMEYLRTREQKLRDTNESTNERVKWFALGTMGMLVALGVWQVVYLRAYFRWVASLRWLKSYVTDETQIEALDLKIQAAFENYSDLFLSDLLHCVRCKVMDYPEATSSRGRCYLIKRPSNLLGPGNST